MAHVTITYSCGHQSIKIIQGSDEEKARKVAAMERNPCNDCIIVQPSRYSWLPELTIGTPNQLAWANQIRDDLVQEILQLKARIAGFTDKEKWAIALKGNNILYDQDATFWIKLKTKKDKIDLDFIRKRIVLCGFSAKFRL